MKLNSIKIKGEQDPISIGDLTILVGPNNVGKSQTLRDIKNFLELGKNTHPIIIESADFDLPESFEEFLELLHIQESYSTIGYKVVKGLKSNLLKNDSFEFNPTTYKAAYENPERRKNEIMGRFTQFFVSYLNSSNRLSLASSVDSLNPENNHPSNLLQSLFLDNRKDEYLKDAFKKAFGMEITLDYSSMLKLCFRIAKNLPIIPDDPRSAYKITNQLAKIEDQGDGFRSFIGIILGLLFSENRIILLDEPEAFLHPAQARFLGKWIGEHKDIIKSQILISTHNSHFLSGLIASKRPIDIYRLNREKDRTYFNKISAETTIALFENPLLSSQRVVESLFYKGVVVCEADSDRAIYQGVASINHNSNEDILFIHSQNKQTLHNVANLLKEAHIAVALVADIDLLNDGENFKNVILSLNQGEIDEEVILLRDEISKSIAGKSEEEELKELEEKINEFMLQLKNREHNIDGAKGALNRIKKSITSWSEIKDKGIEGFNPQIQEKVRNLLKQLKNIGLFIVPVGELEGWINLDTKKKNKWIVPALEVVHLGNAPKPLKDYVEELLYFFQKNN